MFDVFDWSVVLQMNQQPAAPQRQPGQKSKRKHRTSQRKKPREQGATLGDEFRYPEAERTIMVQAVLSQLTAKEAVLIRLDGAFPNAPTRLQTAYTTAWRHVHLYRRLAQEAREEALQEAGHEDMDADEVLHSSDDSTEDDEDANGNNAEAAADAGGDVDITAAVQDLLDAKWKAAIEELPEDAADAEDPSDDTKPSYAAIKEASRFWTRRLLVDGHVHDLPPSRKGQKLKKFHTQFALVHNKILTGWKDVDGRVHAYISLDDLERRDRRKFEADRAKPVEEQVLQDGKAYHELKEEIGVKHNRYMWSHLKAKYPHLRRLKHRMRRARKDRAGVMVCLSVSTVVSALHQPCPTMSCMRWLCEIL